MTMTILDAYQVLQAHDYVFRVYRAKGTRNAFRTGLKHPEQPQSHETLKGAYLVVCQDNHRPDSWYMETHDDCLLAWDTTLDAIIRLIHSYFRLESQVKAEYPLTSYLHVLIKKGIWISIDEDAHIIARNTKHSYVSDDYVTEFLKTANTSIEDALTVYIYHTGAHWQIDSGHRPPVYGEYETLPQAAAMILDIMFR